MNRQCYQLIFNRARGALMAVGEDARATGQGASGQRRAKRAGSTATTTAALLLGSWALHPLAWAQIVADPTAPQSQHPTVLSAPNGVPLVNIQTPSAAGVSRNTYSQFDVQSQGAILNNSRGDVQTQLGGWVQGNPWLLSGGSARVILNEVNSSKPSSLGGWLEVAGQRAEVVIANPAGIQVNGAGFINATGVTLTTGTPVFNGGALEAYRVRGGRIGFGGQGLDTRGVNYTAVLARAVEVNAGIWAERLQVVTGQNQVNASTMQVTPLNDAATSASPSAESTPAFALDVSQIGGMYAGQIHLIGTEAGLGVNQRGVIAATAGNLTLQANGQLDNVGTLQASQGLEITVQDELKNAGQIQAGQDLRIRGEAALSNTGTLHAQGDLEIRAATSDNSGLMAADGHLSLEARNIGNASDGVISAARTTLNAGDTLDNQGVIDGETVRIDAHTLRNHDGGRIYGDTLGLNAERLDNQTDAVIAARGALDIGVQDMRNNDGGLVFSLGALSIGGSLDAQGRAQGEARLLENDGATIESRGDMRIATAELRNLNTALAWEVVANPSTGVTEYYTTGGMLTSDQVGWALSDRRLVPKTSAYGDPAYKRYYEGPDPSIPDQYETIYDEYGNSWQYLVAGASFNYGPNDSIWKDLGVKAPTWNAPSPNPPPLIYSSYIDEYDSYGNVVGSTPNGPPTAASQAAYNDWRIKSAPWGELNKRVHAMRATVNAQLVSYDTYRQYTQTTRRADVTQSAPGRIVSGGNLHIATSVSALNQDATIIAGGNLSITGQTLRNQATEVAAPTSRGGTLYSWGLLNKDCEFLKGCSKKYGWLTAAYAETIDRVVPLDALRYEQNTGPSAGTGANLTLPALNLPEGGLFQAAQPGRGYLIETDPRFANQREWLSSDYLLQAIAFNPTATQKRLGDGFYEQGLIRDQVMQLTGQRFLDDHSDDQAQYQALLDAGVTFAKTHELVPGVTLTPEQIAALTSDIVWLVEREVTLPDGSSTLALVPQVYLAPREGDLTADGKLFGGSSTALLAGRNVNLDLEHDLLNSGSIAGRQVVQINAEGISNLGGAITGDRVALQADQDIRNIGGAIGAESSLSLKAGGDIEITSTTMHGEGETQAGRNGSASYSGEYVDRVAALYVSKSDGVLVASAGNDIHLTGAILSSAGDIGLSAGQDINLATLQTGSQSDVYWDKKTMDANKAKPFSGKPAAPPQGAEVISNENGQITYSRNYAHMGQSAEVGSQLSAGGNLVLNAGQDIHSRAGSVQAEGALLASAGQDITLEAGQSSYNVTAASYASDSGPMVSGSSTLKTSYGGTNAQGSDWGGAVVSLEATRDMMVAGSNVVGDQGTRLEAGEDLRILAVETQSHQSRFEKDTQSGLSTGGMGVSLGTSNQSADQRGTQTHVAGSTVGSIQGDVTVVAGKGYQQVGSDVMAPKGDITIQAESIQIVEARESSKSYSHQEFSQSGLSLGMSSPLLDMAQGLQNTSQAIGNTDSGRMKALGVASAALQGYNQISGTNSLVSNPQQAASVSFSVSVGSSSSENTTQAEAHGSLGSKVIAGGNINLNAVGEGKDSDILVQGSEIDAKKNVNLKAEGDIALVAARNDREQHSDQDSSSFSVGVGFTVGGASNGFGVMASFGNSQMNGDGAETAYTNSQIKAGERIEISSGGDTALVGAVAQASQITAKVGGNLTIQSLQNQATYDERGSSTGGSMFIGTGTSSASASYSETRIESDYASVAQQSGFRAGDGGFQVNVKGNTELIGGAITSSDKAVDGGKNTFQTASLTLRDLENEASYSAESTSVGVGTGGGSAGYGNASDRDSSTTQSAISGIAGNQAARTGDKETGIANNFDLAEVQAELGAQVAITRAFGQNASKAVGDYAQKQMEQADRLEQQAKNESDPVRRAQLLADADQLKSDWGDQGTLRLLAHTTIGALTGGANGATGAALGTLTAPAVADALKEAGIKGPLASILIGAASTAVGTASGGAAGGVAAYNEVTNNYLKHAEVKRQAALHARQKSDTCDNACERDADDLSSLSERRNAEYSRTIQDGSVQEKLNIMPELANDMADLAALKSDLQQRLGATSDPTDRSNLQLEINAVDNSIRQIANLGKDNLSSLYQITGDSQYQDAYQTLMATTSGNEIASALMMPGGGGGRLNQASQDAKPGVNIAEQVAVAKARVELNARRDDNMTTGLVPAEQINKAFVNKGYTEPFANGTYVNVDIAKPGMNANMVVTPGQASAISEGKPALGGFATPDNVPNISFVRRELAITEGMKLAGPLFVQPIVVTGKPMVVVEGMVGPQNPVQAHPGGRNQIFFDYPQNANKFDYIVPAGSAIGIPPN